MATPGKELKRPKLNSVDNLFGIQSSGTATLLLDDNLVPFSNHPFRLYEGEQLEDMVESIKKNGVLVPIIVRKMDTGQLQILSGHNRVNASILAGKMDIPAIIKENLSDEDAWIYVIETNLIQRSFSDMTHSEKAAVLSMQYSKMFSQGKRNDIIAELKRLENPDYNKDNKTLYQLDKELTTNEKIGQAYGLSQATVARYLRIAKLVPDLLEKLDNGVFGFMPAVTLSFLNEQHQSMVNNCIDLNGYGLDMKKADLLREYTDNSKLDEDTIFYILSGEVRRTPKRKRETIRVGNTIIKKYFPPDTPHKKIQDIIDKALAEYFERQCKSANI